MGQVKITGAVWVAVGLVVMTVVVVGIAVEGEVGSVVGIAVFV